MSDTTAKPRPVFRNIHVTDIVSYRLPPAGIVSILHRISGAVLFVLLPFVMWMFDKSVSSEVSYDVFASAFSAGIGAVPGWFLKLVALGLIWAYLLHFMAGVRHLWMDVRHTVSKEQGRNSAWTTLVASSILTVVLGAKLFGLF
jgi:succinate dehydrogenase / fumarate reductase cytochrome b subunit